MKTLFKRYRECIKGVAAIEYALVAPFIGLLALGVVDYGIYIHKGIILQDVARASAQYVVAGGDPAQIVANVKNQSDLFTVSDPQLVIINFAGTKECTCSDGIVISCTSTCSSGDYLRSFYAVTIDATYQPLISFPGLPSSIPMRGYSRLQYNG